jgi:hypothetical protein
MADIAPFVLMGLALVAALVAQGLLMAAREHVRARWPDWYAALAEGGGARLGGPADRVRRRLARLMLTGLPPDKRADPTLAQIADRFRLAMLTVTLSAAGFALIVALRMRAGAP